MYYYLNNHLGTPQQMVDGAGTGVWQADYLPFGKAEVDPPAKGQIFIFDISSGPSFWKCPKMLCLACKSPVNRE